MSNGGNVNIKDLADALRKALTPSQWDALKKAIDDPTQRRTLSEQLDTGRYGPRDTAKTCPTCGRSY